MNEKLTQVEWFDEAGGDLRWRVETKHFSSAARDLRDALERFLTDYCNDPSASSPASLRSLVLAGRDFFSALFFSEQPQADYAMRLYRSLDHARVRIRIKVAPDMTCPWGLAVPPDVAVPAQPSTADLQHLFWCFRHPLSLSTFGAGIDRDRHVAGSEWEAFALVNRGVFERAIETLSHASERSWTDIFFRHLSRLAFASEEFAAWLDEERRPGIKLRLAYLLGHAKGDRFEFSATDGLTAQRLALWLGKNRDFGQSTILFLNGCSTTGEAEGFKFGDIVGHHAVSALIGTEVRVPDRFAFRFALAYLYLVLTQQRSLADALEELRRAHLPVSLAYTLYASDGPSIEAHQGDVVLQPVDSNYSEEALSCPM